MVSVTGCAKNVVRSQNWREYLLGFPNYAQLEKRPRGCTEHVNSDWDVATLCKQSARLLQASFCVASADGSFTVTLGHG